MKYFPLNYEQINIGAGSYNPSPVKAYNNQTFAYWERSLFQRASSILKFTLPDAWQGSVRDFFLFCLFRFGYVTVFDSEQFGFAFQPCTLTGYDFYYQPVTALVSNPRLQREFKIGEECELIKLTPDYFGVWDIISYYAEKLSTLDNAINMALINSKLAYILGAKNKSCAEALKKALDKINKGEPAVILDSKLMMNNPNDTDDPWRFLDMEVKKNYILTDLLQDFQSLKSDFDSEIGIPTLPYQKKERVNTRETVMRSYDGQSRSQIWFDTLTSSLEVVNAHYPEANITVELRYDEEEVWEDEQTDSDRIPELS